MASFPASLDVVEALVDEGRRRVASQIAKREAFLAVAFLAAGVCGLLFFGTDYFPWLLAVLTAALGAYFAAVRRRALEPDAYRIAQQLDCRRNLDDQISTAYHFRRADARPTAFREDQYELARRAAERVDIADAFPAGRPSTARACAWLALAAVLMFGLRAMLQPKVSMEPPLPSLVMAALFGEDWDQETEAVLERSKDSSEPLIEEAALRTEDAPLPPRETAEPLRRTAPLPEEEFQPPETDPDWKPEVEGLTINPEEEFPGDELGLETPAEGSPESSEAGGETPQDPEDNQDWSDESQSLMEKLKQAFENMIETLDMSSSESAEPGDNEGEGERSGEESGESGEPGEGESDTPGEQASNAEMEGGEATDQAGESSEAPGQGGRDANEEPGTGETASASGSNDGSKELADAEQLEAMGEIEQLLMERAENMSGEVTIETETAEQFSAAPLNSRVTTHSDRGGDVSRDEVPAEFREYVQNYFESLRKINK